MAKQYTAVIIDHYAGRDSVLFYDFESDDIEFDPVTYPSDDTTQAVTELMLAKRYYDIGGASDDVKITLLAVLERTEVVLDWRE